MRLSNGSVALDREFFVVMSNEQSVKALFKASLMLKRRGVQGCAG